MLGFIEAMDLVQKQDQATRKFSFFCDFLEAFFTVNSCIEPMKKEKVLKLLEMDFRRLFLSGKDIRVKTTKDSATEKRTSGKGFGKSVVYIIGNTPGDPAQIKIKHPWIRLTIRLDKLSKEI